MPRNQFLDFAKGILIVLVTIGHSIQYVVHRGPGLLSDPLFKTIYLFHMPLFMAISGYLAYPGIRKACATARVGSFSLNKIRAYMIPMLAWAVVYKVGGYFTFGRTAWRDLPGAIFEDFFGGLWFLWALLGSLILTAVIRLLPRGFWLCYGLSLVPVLLLPERGTWVMFKFIYPYFMIGYALAAVGAERLGRMRSDVLFLLSLGFSVWGYALWRDETSVYLSGMSWRPENWGNIGLRFWVGCSASLLALLSLGWVFRRSGPRFGNAVSALGRDSIFIYILQGYALVVLGRLAVAYGFPDVGALAGSAIAIVLGGFVAVSCFLAGRFLARNEMLAAVLFGKTKPKVPAAMTSLYLDTAKADRSRT